MFGRVASKSGRTGNDGGEGVDVIRQQDNLRFKTKSVVKTCVFVSRLRDLGLRDLGLRTLTSGTCIDGGSGMKALSGLI